MADKNHEKRKEKVRNEVSLERDHNRSRSRSEDEYRKKSKRKSDRRKSRKRSHSESDTDSSSSTSSNDSEQRKDISKEKKTGNYKEKETSVKKRKRKRKRRSNSSDNSSSESDEKQSKSKHRQKKKKLKKQKKKKSKSRKAKHEGVVDEKKYGAYGIISDCDLFVKQQEFYCWLQEVKNVNSETLAKFETKKWFESYMEDYNTATFPHKKYYDLEKWEAKRQQKRELKALKKARDTSISIVDDEKRHDLLHRRVATNKYAGPSRQQLLEMQQELRRRQDEEYRKKAGLS